MSASHPWRGHLARSLFSLVIISTLASPALAQLDTQGSGMSDVWQRHFNDGQLFDPENPEHAPHADPDGDGWTNLIESFAGTNPFDNKPPEGIVPAYVVRLNNQEEAPSPEYPDGRLIDLAIISWDTLPGKKYTLLQSADLTASSWIAADVPHYGEGQPIAVTVTLNQDGGIAPEKFFWRVAIGDADTDGDGLSDHEEYLLGSNPFNPYSLGNNIPDFWVAQYLGHIPNIFQNFDLSALSPGGGGSLLEAAISGSDPNQSLESQWPVWTAVTSGKTDSSDPPAPPVIRERTVVLPAGSAALMLVAIASEEFPDWTKPESSNEFNDLLTWKITPSIGNTLQGDYNVNNFHGQWMTASNEQQLLPGFCNFIHYAHMQLIQAPLNQDLTLQITVTAVNVSDNDLASEIAVGILPVNVAVDADRDGIIRFDQSDGTTSERPFRFWINNDQDDVEVDEPVLVDENSRDLLDSTIKTNRDLEDFTRLKISVGIPLQALQEGHFLVGLKFRNPTPNGPAIRIWPNESEEGLRNYLTNGTAAGRQRQKVCHGDTLNGTVFIPKSYWTGRNNTEANLIFEGVDKGEGELVLVIGHPGTSSEIESASVHLKLLDVREMYQRARIVNSAEQISHPWIDDSPPAQTWVWDPWNWPPSEDPDAEPVTAVFVHGWRLKYMDFMNWSDTSYKRLWHQGFKGKFYSFRWATYSGDNNGLPYGLDEQMEGTKFPPGGTTYNASEYRAWLCGPQLASFVNQLPNPGRRSLFAHSMGNVIAGAALRSGMSVQRYALCNAAVATMCYDPDPVLRNNPNGTPWNNLFFGLTPHATPDTDSDADIRGSYGLENKFNEENEMPWIFNFGLPEDTALNSWVLNNLHFKPDGGPGGHHYRYEHYPQPPNLTYKLFQAAVGQNPRKITSQPEAMGYVTKSLTRPAGLDLRVRGSIQDSHNMSSWGPGANHAGFGEVHSAQWRWPYQATHLFWNRLFIELELDYP